jgi:uncharacterized protein
MPSLQDQLLKAGLIDPKKAKQADKEKRKEQRVARRDKTSVDTVKLEREAALAEKQERDRELNRQRDEALQQKAIVAQIKQLIANHKQSKRSPGEEVEYHFTDKQKIKKMRVGPLINRQILNGQLAIVKADDTYELVPRIVADKIAQRDRSFIIVLNTESAAVTVDEEDPYKDYQIPDDLMW